MWSSTVVAHPPHCSTFNNLRDSLGQLEPVQATNTEITFFPMFDVNFNYSLIMYLHDVNYAAATLLDNKMIARV